MFATCHLFHLFTALYSSFSKFLPKMLQIIFFPPYLTQSLPTYFVGFMADIIVARYVIFAFGFLLAVAASFFYSHLLRYESVGQVSVTSISINFVKLKFLLRSPYCTSRNTGTYFSVLIISSVFMKATLIITFFPWKMLTWKIFLDTFFDLFSLCLLFYSDVSFFLFPTHSVVCVLDKSGDDFLDDVRTCSIVSVHGQ